MNSARLEDSPGSAPRPHGRPVPQQYPQTADTPADVRFSEWSYRSGGLSWQPTEPTLLSRFQRLVQSDCRPLPVPITATSPAPPETQSPSNFVAKWGCSRAIFLRISLPGGKVGAQHRRRIGLGGLPPTPVNLLTRKRHTDGFRTRSGRPYYVPLGGLSAGPASRPHRRSQAWRQHGGGEPAPRNTPPFYHSLWIATYRLPAGWRLGERSRGQGLASGLRDPQRDGNADRQRFRPGYRRWDAMVSPRAGEITRQVNVLNPPTSATTNRSMRTAVTWFPAPNGRPNCRSNTSFKGEIHTNRRQMLLSLVATALRAARGKRPSPSPRCPGSEPRGGARR